ncbi:hypothetical protein C8R47DRAFT_1205246 [Mycena vitilis]|nr:hypothetical protein C8R47DRAFT_1205246 [Mycena vitilis]
MSAAAPAPAVNSGPFKGVIDMKRSKPELEAIAIALNIPTVDGKKKKLNKDQLIPLIVKRLFTDEPSLQNDPTFSALYGKTTGGKGGAKKTSAEKNEEVAHEQSKPAQALTGANLKLHEKKVAMDPPASFGRVGLSLQGNTKKANEKGALPSQARPPSDTSSLTSEMATRPSTPVREEGKKEQGVKDVDDKEKDLDEEEKNIQFSTQASKGIVVVQFSHPHRQEVTPHEVIVGGIAITNSIAPGGAVTFHASLKDLVPLALNSSSPMKQDRSGRIARPGLVEPTHPLDIGSIAQNLDGPFHSNLRFERTDTLVLETTEHPGEFKCGLFYEPTSAQLQPAAPTSLTGAGTDRPQDIAQARASAVQIKQTLTVKACADFGDAICVAAGLTKLDLATNQVAKTGLLNYRVFDAELKKAETLSTRKGFAIPAEN